MKQERVSWNFMITWTKSPNQNFTQDNRGWQKGKRRKWGKETEKRIKEIYKQLNTDPSQFYTGATAIVQKWKRRYPQIPSPPLITIGRILSDLGLSNKRRKDRHKGASRYLCYPEYTIYNLFGGRILEADFIGRKFITGQTEPLNFIAFCFKKEPRLRYFQRVDSQTSDNFIKQTKYFFRKFEKPNFVKVDNCLATIGSASGKRNLSRTMKFLLKNQVIPIFAVPRKPFSQASIEGNNSVFARKFWNKINFQSIAEIDEKLEWFNKSSEQYLGYKRPDKKPKKRRDFLPRVYFIRQVKEDKQQTQKAYIDVLNEKVFLPQSYLNYFVLAEWNLKKENLYIWFEKEQKPEIIKKISFEINPKSLKGCSHFI